MADATATLTNEIDQLKEKVKAKTASPSEKLRLKRLKLDLDEHRYQQKVSQLADRRRAMETKQKIVLGAWVLETFKQDEALKSAMRSKLASFLNERDQALLDDVLRELT